MRATAPPPATLAPAALSRVHQPGQDRARNTKTAVTSFRSFGLRPPRSAMATSRRKSTEPITAPVMIKPELPHADQRLADDDARQAPDDHADAHLDVGEALILREQRARQRDQAVRQRQAEHDHVLDVHAERADHLRVVAGGLHRRAEVRAEEHVDQQRPTTATTTSASSSIAASRSATSQPQTRRSARGPEQPTPRRARPGWPASAPRAAARCSSP